MPVGCYILSFFLTEEHHNTIGGVRQNLIHHNQCLHVTVISLESSSLLTLLTVSSEAENKSKTILTLLSVKLNWKAK